MKNTLLALYSSTAEAVPVFVIPSGAGTKDGSNWANALEGNVAGGLKTKIDAIADANSTKIYLVLMADGVYKQGAVMGMKKT